MITSADLQQLRHLLQPLRQRLASMVAKGVVKIVNDVKKLQLVQLGVLSAEPVPDVEHHQPYGFSSVPLAGAEAVLVGDRSRPMAVVISDRRHRPTGGQAGEVCIYTDEGDVIRLGRGHVISLVTSGQVKLGSASASGAVVVQAALTDFMTALGQAISAQAGNPPGAAALSALQTALAALNAATGWKARTTKTKAE